MKPIPPGATIGIVGGGQLGQMIALEAKRMGYRIGILDPDPTGPGAKVADHYFEGAWSDCEAARALAAVSDVVTIDTEHVPAELLEELEELTLVRPGAKVLSTVQDRLRQRRFAASCDLPQPRHAPVDSAEDFEEALQHVGVPAVLKTRRDGYDGKGQARIGSLRDLETAWEDINRAPAILEEFIDLEREISAILARGTDGEARLYPVAENLHRRHILHMSRVPARISLEHRAQVAEYAERVAHCLGHVGAMGIEFFISRGGDLLLNEIAPRTHNSGHYSFGACATSQFEQHVRAICSLPLGDSTLLRPVVMLNILGDAWSNGPPRFDRVLEHPGVRLHLYGKERAEPGRKMGHVLVLDSDVEEAERIAAQISSLLEPSVASDG
ncbi:MAG: 5-(carboxyamino)imidazole ribonucleotide synthase [Myxococcales bacterium]|nr:5-(carboxyamino)imidazole ribonucleotide synthase [Myxococcales bacterium]